MFSDYYTYAYLREDKTPYYIGKGRGNRAYDKERTIKPSKDKSRIIFLKKNLTEAEAFKHEVYMIFVFGRKDIGTGILHNRTNGGEGSSGAVVSEETKRKMREAKSGKGRTEETKKKIGAGNSKSIIAIIPNGAELRFGSCIEAAKELGINPGNLSGRYLKNSKSPTGGKFKGWRFVYENS